MSTAPQPGGTSGNGLSTPPGPELIAADALQQRIVELGAEITADYAPGEVETVRMPDGSQLRLRKLDTSYDPHNRAHALEHVLGAQQEGEVVTGLLYVDPDASDCHEILDTVETPLNALGEEELCPGSDALERINASFR